MKRQRVVPAIAAVFTLVATLGQVDPAAAERWLHVRVVEQDADGATVEVNLPINLVHKAIPLVEGASADARLDFGRRGYSGRDLKELLRELTASPDGEYVTIHDDGDEVRVTRQGRLLLVDVTERDHRGAKVQARIPLRVVEALASGKDDALDVAAALEALAQEREGELVTIVDDGGTTHVRMWIDSRDGQGPEA